MVDWLACSTCFTGPGDGRYYYLTTCGHIFCEKCEHKGWREQCLICSSKAPSTLQLTSLAKLPPTVQCLFTDVADTAKKIEAQCKQLGSAIEFQQSKRKRRFAHQQEMITKQGDHIKKVENALMADKAQNDSIKSENERLKRENSYLKHLLIKERPRGGGLRSPSGDWKSPGQKALVTSTCQNVVDERRNSTPDPLSSLSTGSQRSSITSGRVSMRTPPSGARIGVIPNATPSPYFQRNAAHPMSLPRPINFGEGDRK